MSGEELAAPSTVSRLDQLRGRGQATLESALLMLDLYAVSEVAERERLIQMASRSLPARAVVDRFIQLAAEESNDELREQLVARLFWVDIRELSDLSAWISLLSSCLTQERVRARAAACLSRIVAGSPAAQEALIAACRATVSRAQERALLEALCALETPTAPVRALFLERLGRVDADFKFALLARLLSGGGLPWETLAPLLSPTEPASIKWLVLEQLLERPLAPGSHDEAQADAALVAMLARDPEPACRGGAVEVLATRAGKSPLVAPALLAALRSDPDSQVRAAAMLAFAHSLETSPEALAALAEALSTERTREGFARLLQLVSPLAGRSPAVRSALVKLLGDDLRKELLEQVVGTLGKLASGDPQLAALLLGALETERDQRVRVALMEGLLLQPDAEGAQLPLHLAALKSSDARLRTLGVKGLLRVPLQPLNLAALAPAVEALKDPAIERWSRVPLARKLARLTQADPQRALGPHFKRVAPLIEDGELRGVCEEAADRAASAAQDGAAIDWDDWFQRAEVEHRTDGIFPELFVRFDQNPEAARRILRAVLNPPAVDTLYQTYRGQLSAGTIVSWLRDRGLVDDDISRYCISYLLNPQNHGGDAFHLGVLKSNPGYPPLRDDVWRLLEQRKEAPPVLMRELVLCAYSSDAAALPDLKARLSALASPEQARLFLRFLLGNPLWEPARAGFLSLKAEAPSLADAEVKKLLEEVAKAMNLKLPAPAATPVVDEEKKSDGPGFADE